MTTLSPRPDFDWSRLKWSEPHSTMPVKCSYCDGWIHVDAEDFEDGYVPLMMWKEDGSAAIFCEDCMRKWWGFRGGHEE